MLFRNATAWKGHGIYIYIHMISEKKLVHGLRPEMGKEESYLTGRSISRDVAPVLIDKSKGTTGAPAMPIASF
jgi:hypothetical protein